MSTALAAKRASQKRAAAKSATPARAKSAVRASAKTAVRGPAKSAVRGPAKGAARGPAKSAVRPPTKSAAQPPAKSAARAPATTLAAPVRAAVLGADVSRSRSPDIHSAAFRALGIAGVYEAHSVTARGFRTLVRSLARDGYRYLNVTIPHKNAAAAMATSRSAAVRASGAANTLIFDVGKKSGARAALKIRAENTDGPGMLAALRDLGAEAAGATAVVVGAGGAAAGAVEALTAAGARVRVVARRPALGRAMKARLPARQRALINVVAWDAVGLVRALAGARIVVSAVPAAAWEGPESCAGLDALEPSAAVLEMAYGAETPLARAVRGRARGYADGLGMLVHQAAVAIKLALGKDPPLPELFRSVMV